MALLRKSPDKEDAAAAAPAISKDSNSGSTAKTVASTAAVPAKSATAAAGLPSSVKLSSEASDTFQKTSAAAAVRIYFLTTYNGSFDIDNAGILCILYLLYDGILLGVGMTIALSISATVFWSDYLSHVPIHWKPNI